ncbi:MAG TPA: vWA domain-containing protein [Burkholderiales bacterium]|nr:vWA domain-containing protein [Burkholderiales bacterium]
MNLNVTHPWVLVLIPLVLLPLLRVGKQALVYPWLQQLPPDPLSDVLGWILRAVGMIALLALILGLAGLHRSELVVQRLGRGAQIVLLLDRSRSMDQPFNLRQIFDTSRRSKGKVARSLLAEFAANRPEDMFGMVEFSTYPIRVLEFTQKQDVIQSAISAAGLGTGLAETDIGRGLETALDYFADRPYTGSRIILLVSDGGAVLDEDTRAKITRLMRRDRVALYWIYIRSFRSPGLLAESDTPENADAVPEHFLHKFFKSMGTPYRAYEAENPDALQRAIADVSRLENHPLRYDDVLPRRDLSEGCFAAALLCCVMLTLAKIIEVRAWR